MSLENNVKNIVKLIGEPKAIKKAMGELIIDGDRFVFDSFSPLPDELLGTDPGQKIIADEEYELVLTAFNKKMDNGELEKWDSIPMSLNIHKMLVKKYGYDNWFDWSMNHWGTKFGPYATEIISDNEFSFFTINATPHSAMVKMSMKYPKIEFNVRYADEDMGYNVGEYTLLNGETIHTNVPPSDTFNEESYLMAYKTIDDDYHVRELIYELTETEIDNTISGRDEYLQVMLNVILELEIIDKHYPIRVIKFLLDKAVTTEQYEYAAELKKLLDSEIIDNKVVIN